MIDMPTLMISAVLGCAGGFVGAQLFRVIRKPLPPPWIGEMTQIRKADQIAFDALRTMVTDQQNKVGQAYQVFGLWAHHFGKGTKPTAEEEEMVLDYFGIEENYDPDFLRKAPKK